ncbi:hypothetical protein BC827DRAFT_1250972 [Russula dissimulans]|nr:hypothetical protein BC827DRAFT_1250972 [Russula dissimulans]
MTPRLSWSRKVHQLGPDQLTFYRARERELSLFAPWQHVTSGYAARGKNRVTAMRCPKSDRGCRLSTPASSTDSRCDSSIPSSAPSPRNDTMPHSGCEIRRPSSRCPVLLL